MGRYTFGGTGAETLVQNATNYASTADDTKIDDDWQELETSSLGNTTAKSLSTFVSKTNSNGGYYLARYEASYKDNTHCYSKKSTSTRTSRSTALTSGMLWNFITQPDAATIARNMYTSTNFESDLVNSYAWDTAIVFIQAYSGDNDYSRENGQTFSSSLANTGTNGDKRCNIYDMASNTREWSTETYTDADYPCTTRGGNCFDSRGYAAYRGHSGTSYSAVGISFRLSFYLK